MIKVIATDLDGTLFYPKRKLHLISKKNKQFLQNALESGKEIILVTGRNYRIATKVEECLERKNQLSIVGCNGAFMIHKGELVEETPMDNEEAFELYEKLSELKIVKVWMIFGNDKVMYVDSSNVGPFVRACGYLGFNLQGAYYEPFVISKSKTEEFIKNPSNKIYKMMPWFGTGKKGVEKARLFTEKWNAEHQGNTFTFSWSGNAIEITDGKVTKAVSLVKLIEKLGYTREEVAVVGDSGNDVSMFKEFPNSFCMQHAPSQVKKEAKTIIKSFDDLKNYIK